MLVVYLLFRMEVCIEKMGLPRFLLQPAWYCFFAYDKQDFALSIVLSLKSLHCILISYTAVSR